MNEQIRDSVLDIMCNVSGLNKEDLFLASRLEQDLNITGDDAWAVLESLRNKHVIDLRAFQFDQYFNGEAEGWLSALLHREKRRHREAFPVTVGHLVCIVENGHWFKPPQVKKM
ncbi:MAG: DUF1493 family protein [Pseudomonadota bacterium]